MSKTQKNRKLLTGILLSLTIFLVVMISSVMQKPIAGADNSTDSFKIISLAPNITEMLFALGVEDCIVGRSDHCDYPPEAKAIESVGSLGIANIEKVLSLKPDLLITPNTPDKGVRKLFAQADIELLVIQSSNVHGMLQHLLSIGKAVGKPDIAASVVNKMQARLNTIAARYEKIDKDKLPRVFIEISNDPMITVGGTSFISDVVRCAGGVNVASQINDPYPCINPEKIIEWNPDIILPCYMGDKANVARQMARRIGWDNIAAIKTGRIIVDFPNDLIMRGGPRLIDGIETLSQHLHGTVNKNVATDNTSGQVK
jgi:iron complex transport system substrate-binding protein